MSYREYAKKRELTPLSGGCDQTGVTGFAGGITAGCETAVWVICDLGFYRTLWATHSIVFFVGAKISGTGYTYVCCIYLYFSFSTLWWIKLIIHVWTVDQLHARFQLPANAPPFIDLLSSPGKAIGPVCVGGCLDSNVWTKWPLTYILGTLVHLWDNYMKSNFTVMLCQSSW